MASTKGNVPTIISSRVEKCLALFEKWRQEAGEGRPQAEDALSLFRLWATNNFIFTGNRMCLDWRLRGIPVLSGVIGDLLDDLESTLLELRGTVPKSDLGQHNQQIGSENTAVDKVQNIQRQLFDICHAIHRSGILSRLSRISGYTELLEVDGIVINNTELVRKRIEQLINERYPLATDTIRQRLVNTMSLRRQNFLYLRDRESKASESLARRAPEAPQAAKPVQQELPMHPASNLQDPSPEPHTVAEKVKWPAPKFRSPPSAMFSASTANPSKVFKPASVRSSSFRDANLLSLDQITPPPPKATDSSGYLKCPYCFMICQKNELQGKSWQRHFFQDLMPYVCLLEDCATPDVLYESFKEWTNHMTSQHPITTWTCSNKVHRKPCHFNTSAELEKHMLHEHSGGFKEADLTMLIEASKISQPRTYPLTECPLCFYGLDDGTIPINDVLAHVAEHLVSLARLFSPSPDGGSQEGGEEFGSQGGLTPSSSAEESRTLGDQLIEPPLAGTFESGEDGTRSTDDALSANLEPHQVIAPTPEDYWDGFWSGRRLPSLQPPDAAVVTAFQYPRPSSTVRNVMYRVRGIPWQLDRLDAAGLIGSILDISASDVFVFSLATAITLSEPRTTKTATVMFQEIPKALKGGIETTEWTLGSERENVRLIVDTHFLGFTPFNDTPVELRMMYPAPVIIAVSGPISHPMGPWKTRGEKSSFMWLRDALPKMYPQAKVFLYGHNQQTTHIRSSQSIADLAQTFTLQLRGASGLLPSGPVVFIAHSVGGLIVKQAIVNMADGFETDQAFLSRLKGCIFFGVPNLGLQLEHLPAMTAQHPNESLIHDLSRGSDYLQSLDKRFSGLSYIRNMRIFWAFETRVSPSFILDFDGRYSMSGPPSVVVTRASATGGLWMSDPSASFAVDSNHGDLVRFGQGDVVLDIVVLKLRAILEHDPASNASAAFQHSRPSNIVPAPPPSLASTSTLTPTTPMGFGPSMVGNTGMGTQGGMLQGMQGQGPNNLASAAPGYQIRFSPVQLDYEESKSSLPEQTFQVTTNTFKNSMWNRAHYGNPDFHPEEWIPDDDAEGRGVSLATKGASALGLEQYKRPNTDTAASNASQTEVEIVNTPNKGISTGGSEIYNEIIMSLKSPDLYGRQQQIEKAHLRTLEWVYDDPNTGFSSWLTEGQGIFWIHGKPGSGKSTLMQFISENPRTRELLQVWAKEGPVVSANFFFHHRGTILQKSFEGLLRSILCQLIEARPKLASLLAPISEALPGAASTPAAEGLSKSVVWNRSSLETGLRMILDQNQGPLDLCFFFDALDEYDGSPELITRFLNDLVGRSNAASTSSIRIKACVASRPLSVFMAQFRSYHGFAVPEFTRGDIMQYCVDSISFFRIPPESRARLVQYVVNHAQGIFLWVKLAIRDLSDAVSNGCSLDELQQKLYSLPTELAGLYAAIIERLPLSNRWKTYAIFEIISRSKTPMNPRALWHAADWSACQTYEQAKEQFMVTHDPGERSFNEMINQSIHQLTGGLVDVGGESEPLVTFMHSTVAEFINIPGFKALVLGQDLHWTHENGHSFLAKAYLIDEGLKNEESWQLVPEWADYFLSGVTFSDLDYNAREAERTTGLSLKGFLDTVPPRIFTRVNSAVASPLGFAVASGLQLYIRESLAYPELFRITKDPLLSICLPPEELQINRHLGQDRLKMAQLILDQGFDVSRDRGVFMKVMMEIRWRRREHEGQVKQLSTLAILLLEHKQDPVFRIGSKRWTPLHVAPLELAQWLLQHNVDPNIEDREGATPLDYNFGDDNHDAAADNHKLCMLIMKAGGKCRKTSKDAWAQRLEGWETEGIDVGPFVEEHQRSEKKRPWYKFRRAG